MVVPIEELLRRRGVIKKEAARWPKQAIVAVCLLYSSLQPNHPIDFPRARVLNLIDSTATPLKNYPML